MPKTRQPRYGSMQFWPRVRAANPHAKIRSWAKVHDAVPLCFPGYKVGMTHIFVTDNGHKSKTKGEEIFMPVTIIECPPIKVAAIRFYKTHPSSVIVDHFAEKLDKELYRSIMKPKVEKPKAIPADFDDLVLLIYTQPKYTRVGKKKPELFEVALGGKKEEKLVKAKELLGKEVPITDVFKEGMQLDVHTITTGKGVQGPVKRFGISLRSHKSEKSRRAAVLGPWCGQGHVMYRVAHAGKMGYHQRIEYNKVLIKFTKPEEVAVKGGFVSGFLPKSQCILIKGSVAGPTRRMVKLTRGIRPTHYLPKEAPAVTYISLHSPQGR